MIVNWDQAEKLILNGKIGVVPTDTIYGIVGSSLNKKVVSKIFRVKKRNPSKPFINLISSVKDLQIFGISLSSAYKNLLKALWPGPITLVFSDYDKKFQYLAGDSNGISFRLPKNYQLKKLLRKTGPLVAPSANPESFKPASSVSEAINYFRKNVDFYLDGGYVSGQPSIILKLEKDFLKIIRI